MNNNNFKFYYDSVICLIAQYPEFQKKVQETCPTFWADGTICSPIEDALNKAFLEVERLVWLDLI